MIKDNKIWLGFGFKGSVGFFQSNYVDNAICSHHKEGMIRVPGVQWFTNLDIQKRHEVLNLYKEYNSEDYPKYDNYDAINVDKTKDIPCDYDGIMGVPITFLDRYNPDQFKIIGMSANGAVPDYVKLPWNTKHNNPFINGNPKYQRLFIKRKVKEKNNNEN